MCLLVLGVNHLNGVLAVECLSVCNPVSETGRGGMVTNLSAARLVLCGKESVSNMEHGDAISTIYSTHARHKFWLKAFRVRQQQFLPRVGGRDDTIGDVEFVADMWLAPKKKERENKCKKSNICRLRLSSLAPSA